MVCPRCVIAVKGAFEDLGHNVINIHLGEVQLNEELKAQQKKEVGSRLQTLGFELLETGKSTLISQIKSLIIEQIHYKTESLKVNFSTFLAENLHHDYSYLSRLFSSVEGITIEKFITQQKIERVKELLFYNQLTLSEIAFQLDYSSTAHLSSQFKKETGMTPSAFKSQHKPGHRHLDSI